MNRPHVLLTTDLIGGVWDFSLVLARALDMRVTLLALGDATDEQRRAAADVDAELVVEPVKLEWMHDAEVDVLRTREVVERLARALRPDIIHANQFAAACVTVDVPVVLTVHSDVLSWRRWTLAAGKTPTEWLAYADLVREALARADHVVAVSGFLAEQVRELYGCARPVDVIHNGWPLPVRHAAKEPITLLAGRAWDAAKNVELAMRAARRWEPGLVYLAGDTAHPESGGGVEVAEPIQLLGRLTRAEMDKWLGRAAVYLSPARYDPFGLSPLQAALGGCVLLLSDIPSYRELWDGAACFFRSDDPDHLRDRWRWLLEHPDRRLQLADRGRRRAERRYTTQRTASAYRALYATTQRSVAA